MGILDKFKRKSEEEDLPDLPEPPETSSPPGISTDKPSSLGEDMNVPVPTYQPEVSQTPVEQMSEVTPVKPDSDLKTEIEILSAKIDAIKSRLEAVNNKLDAVYRVVLGGAKYQ